MKHYTENILEAPPTEPVCWCHNVTKGQILTALQTKAKNFVDVRNITQACTGGDCKKNNPRGRCCSTEITQLVHSVHPPQPSLEIQPVTKL